jgi:hypothetical protein
MPDRRTQQDGYEEIEGLDCVIALIPRPSYCDRGNVLAMVNLKAGGDPRRLNLDHQDGWPRYYMDHDRAKFECEDWLKKRKQWIG